MPGVGTTQGTSFVNASSSSSTGSSGSGTSGNSSAQGLLKQEEAQFLQNFELQTQSAMADNTNATHTAISNSHAQTWAGASAAARESGEANQHIEA